MALTKARPPVTDISQMANGTTVVDIPTAAADIDIDVAGLDVIDLGSTTITIDDLVTLVANTITGESVSLSTSGGAAGSAITDATDLTIGTTSAHPLLLMANSITGLTMGTDGKVALGVDGTGATHLVDKGYVDTQVALAATLTDIDATMAVTGHITIPNSTGNDLIINWGAMGSASNNADTTVTFDQAFANAFFGGVATSTETGGTDGALTIHNGGLTTMDIHNDTDKTSNGFYIALGY